MKKLTLLWTCFLISMGLAIAQTKQVSGKVVDDTGEPVIGATVIVKGNTTIGTATDFNGAYTLSVPESATHLIIKYLGMQEREVEATTNVQITLTPDSKALSEVVIVGAMGILRPARSIGFGQSVVDPNEAVQKSEPDLFRSLQGKIPGVQVSAASSTPGSATKILVRGNSSFFGSNDPLYVVDGIPYSNPEVTTGSRLVTAGAYGTGLSTLDPNDIESMEVLKGASAAALYGSRAANGVVLIITKSGSKKQTPSQKKNEMTFTSSYTIENPASLPDYQNSYGQGSNFMYSNANGSWGPAFGKLDSIPTFSNYLAAYPDMPAKLPYQAYPNNVSGLFRQGNMLENSVNLVSYNNRGNFNATVSHVSQDGYIPHSEFERTSFSVGGNQKLENGFTIGGTISFSRAVQDGPFFGAGNYGGSVSSFARTLLMPRNINAVGLPYETPDGNSLFPFSATTVDNPLWSWKNNKINSINDRTVSTINVGYDVTKWLTAYYQYGWNQYRMDRKQIINIGSTGPSGYAGKGQILNDHYTTQEIESNFNLTFKHKVYEDLNLRAVLGHNVNQRATIRTNEQGDMMIFRGIYNIDNTQQQSANEYHSKRRLWALYTDIMLNYKNYGFLTFTLRNDHSSTLPVKYNSYFYPSISGSFVLSDAFEINPNVLNFGKIRAGWGKVGNDALPYYVNGKYGSDTPFDGRPVMYVPTTSYDPELKPEFKSEYELGVELMFFKSRIGIDFTWYDQTLTNQIGSIQLPRSTGSSSYYTNFGKMTNKGVEIGLTLVPVDMSNSFRWHIYSTFTKNISKVVELLKGDDDTPLTLSTGSTSEPQPTMKVGKPYGFLRGSVIVRADDGTPLINPSSGTFILSSDLEDLGNPYPDFQAAVTNTFYFKGFSLRAMFNASVGGVIVSGPASDMLGRGVTKDTEDRLGSRILYGYLANPNTYQPILDSNGNKILNTIQLSENDLWFAPASTTPTFAMNGVAEFSTFDATVFRLSEISLGYDLPKNILRKTFLGSATISIIARNLWHFAPGFPKYTNYDPGSNTWGAGNVQGIDKETASTTKRIGFNVKLTF